MKMNNGVQTVVFLVGILCLALTPTSKCDDTAQAAAGGYSESLDEGERKFVARTRANVTPNGANAASQLRMTGDGLNFGEGVVYTGVDRGSDSIAETGGSFTGEVDGNILAGSDTQSSNRGTSTEGNLVGEGVKYLEGGLVSSATKKEGRRLKVAI